MKALGLILAMIGVLVVAVCTWGILGGGERIHVPVRVGGRMIAVGVGVAVAGMLVWRKGGK